MLQFESILLSPYKNRACRLVILIIEMKKLRIREVYYLAQIEK